MPPRHAGVPPAQIPARRRPPDQPATPEFTVSVTKKFPFCAPPARRRASPTRERGRPARTHCRSEPLSTPTMWQPATPPPTTPCSRPKQSPGEFAGRPGWVPPATLSLQAASHPRPILCKGRRACLCRVGSTVPRPMRAGRPRSRVINISHTGIHDEELREMQAGN